MLRRVLSALPLVLLASACSSDPTPAAPPPIHLKDDAVRVTIALEPFQLTIADAAGKEILHTLAGDSGDAYGAPSATVDHPDFLAQSLPGWDGYLENVGPWRHASQAKVRSHDATTASLDLTGNGIAMRLDVALEGPRVKLHVEASATGGGDALNKTSLAFAAPADEHFYGMGERYASVDHRGLSLYSWAEEGALGKGENAPVSDTNPYPNGPSMTYFPVPFFLSSDGYAMHLATTYRTEVHLASERDDAYRVAVNAAKLDTTIYVHDDPLASLADYTEDTGRPPVPATWVFGPRRRVDVNATVNDVPEWQLMRDKKVPVTGIDDAVHFLPASSQLGKEDLLKQWTTDLHAAGYKVMAYNNPYVASNDPNAADIYSFGAEHGYFLKEPDGNPVLTQFISGKLLEVSPIDLTNPDAVTWFQSLLKRSLDLGYDGWMHDFGEYTPRDAIAFDGRRGDELHDEYPVLSAKAAHDLLEKERPGDYLFFVRSGYSGTQKYVPAVWGGDAEATFDETLGLPSSVRGGVNLSMSGVPYWGSDMTGFKCITSAPNDKEVFLRWVELGAISPIMMEQNACSNPAQKKTKWTLWSDDETTTLYAKYSGLHTRLAPYFAELALEAHASGRPITLHPFLLFPHEAEAWKVDDAYFLGPALYAMPVVRRGQTEKKGWLPPGKYVELEDDTVYEGGKTVTIPAPLGKLPLLLTEAQLLPMLDPSVQTLAEATDPTVVTASDMADRLDVVVALAPGDDAKLTLADGTTLEAARGSMDAGNASGLTSVAPEEVADCAGCYTENDDGDVHRLRATTALATSSDVTIADLHLVASGPLARRIRWDVRRLP